jgi:hypothetical protein
MPSLRGPQYGLGGGGVARTFQRPAEQGEGRDGQFAPGARGGGLAPALQRPSHARAGTSGRGPAAHPRAALPRRPDKGSILPSPALLK